MVTKRKFAKEFKLKVLQELESKTSAEVCREHELNADLINRWKREYQQNPEKAFSSNGNVWKEDARIAQYERLIGQLYAEIALLKKTNTVLYQRKAEEKMRCTKC